MRWATYKKTKVFIFADQPLFREGIRNRLLSEPDIEVIGDSNISNQTILLSLQLVPPEVTIVDIDYQVDSGLSLCRRLLHLLPDVKIIALGADHDDATLVEILKVKLAAYLSRNISGEDLLDIIGRVANHEESIYTNLEGRPGVIKKVIGELREASGDEQIIDISSPLRRRETEVISYVAEGYSNKEIAIELGISEQTVKSHVSSIMTKLDAKGRTEAAVIAVKKGWIAN